MGNIPILFKGSHRIPFNFPLPETSLPGSFESKLGTVRYWIKAVLDIPYASPPQGMKYFTIIGPYIDCMDEKYLVSTEQHSRSNKGLAKIGRSS